VNILLDAEVLKLRDTLRRGLSAGQWELKVGEQLYIKTDAAPSAVPTTIEFSERAELYRRGILKPPELRVVEMRAQRLPGGSDERTVRVRWRTREALKVRLFQGGNLIGDTFCLPMNTPNKLPIELSSKSWLTMGLAKWEKRPRRSWSIPRAILVPLIGVKVQEDTIQAD